MKEENNVKKVEDWTRQAKVLSENEIPDEKECYTEGKRKITNLREWIKAVRVKFNDIPGNTRQRKVLITRCTGRL